MNSLFPKSDYTQLPRDAAGRKMTQEVPVLQVTKTIGDVLSLLKKHVGKFRTINYIYLVDDEFRLVGILSLKYIFGRPPQEQLVSIARMTNLITVHPEADQERVAYLALKNNLKAIPVVDKDKTLLGVVPNDSILGVLYKELREDLLHLAGIQTKDSAVSFVDTPLLTAVRQRIVWLILGLLGGVFAAWIIGRFEHTIQQDVLIAAFLPLVVYMNNAVGLQVQSMSIRDFSAGEVVNFKKYFLKHFLVVLVLAVLMGSGAAVLGLLLFKDVVIPIILVVSLLVGILSSIITGLCIPYLLLKMHQDPAHGSGPVATSAQDILSITIYLLVSYFVI